MIPFHITIKNWIEKNRNNGYIEKEEMRGKSKNGGRIPLEDYKERYKILKKYQTFLKAQRERK